MKREVKKTEQLIFIKDFYTKIGEVISGIKYRCNENIRMESEWWTPAYQKN